MRRLLVVLGQAGTSQSELLAKVGALPGDVVTTLVSCVAVDAELAHACERVVLLAGARIRVSKGSGVGSGAEPVSASTSSHAGAADGERPAAVQSQPAATVQERGDDHSAVTPQRLIRASVRIGRGLFLRVGGPTARAVLRQLSGLRLRRDALGSREIQALAKESDVLCAADGFSVLAAWSLARRHPRPAAVLGLGAADYELRRMPAGG